MRWTGPSGLGRERRVDGNWFDITFELLAIYDRKTGLLFDFPGLANRLVFIFDETNGASCMQSGACDDFHERTLSSGMLRARRVGPSAPPRDAP